MTGTTGSKLIVTAYRKHQAGAERFSAGLVLCFFLFAEGKEPLAQIVQGHEEHHAKEHGYVLSELLGLPRPSTLQAE